MAQNLLLENGSPLIGSPIVYGVTAASLANLDTVTFHRVKLKVTAGLQGGDFREFVMSSPVEDGERIMIDISSALRAVADEYEYTAEPPVNYPYITFSLEACDEYMQNGEIHENVGVTKNDGGRALMGGYSDLDRILSGGSKSTSAFSRKPTSSPEIVCEGEEVVCPQDMVSTIGNITRGPSSIVKKIVIDSDNPVGARSVLGRDIFAMERYSSDRYEFRFVNSLGCLESIGVYSLRSTKVNVSKEEYSRSVSETFGKFSRGYITKANDYETWSMSSGPLTEDWQQWFLHEFLMAKFVWVKISGHWIPCHILPDDTVSGIDRTNASMLTVSFSVRLDINSSPFLTV